MVDAVGYQSFESDVREVIDEPVSEPLGELATELAACAAGIQDVDRRMEMQSFGYTRNFAKYVWAILHFSGRVHYTDRYRGSLDGGEA